MLPSSSFSFPCHHNYSIVLHPELFILHASQDKIKLLALWVNLFQQIYLHIWAYNLKGNASATFRTQRIYWNREIYANYRTNIFLLYVLYSDTKKLKTSKAESIIQLWTMKKELEKRLKKLSVIPSACSYADPKAVDEDVSNSLVLPTCFWFCMSKILEFVQNFIRHQYAMCLYSLTLWSILNSIPDLSLK